MYISIKIKVKKWQVKKLFLDYATANGYVTAAHLC